MKKIVYSICVLLTSLFFTRNAHAIWPDFTPAIPFSPQLCVMCIPPAISVAVSYYDQAMQLKEDLQKYTDITTLKQMAASYVSKMGTTAFNKWRQSKNTRDRGISYARTIEDSKIADLKDEASVKNAFVKLFMQYPSDKSRTKAAYKTIGEQLKMDTTLEMYLTAVEMEKKLYGNTKAGKESNDSKNMEDLGLLKQIDLFESCLVQGENCDIVGLNSCQEKSGGGSDDTKEDQACFWNSALQAEKLYDEIMRYNLFLITMHAQYQAVTGIDILAKIKEYDAEKKGEDDKKKDEDKSSFLIEPYFMPSTNTAMSGVSAQAAFADLSPEEEEFAESELSGYEESLLSHENVIDGTFEDADHPDGFTLTIGEREDDIASLEIIGEARSDLNQAQKIHNLKKTLPEYKKVYQDYADAQAKMEQAKANLQASGECVENMMAPYYDNPSAVWLGGSCTYYREGQLACHYEPEKSADDESESDGLFDILCPDNGAYNCYVQELRSSNITGGVAKYLLELYSAAKDEDAAGDTEAFINTEEEQQDGGYVSRATITTGGEGSEVSEDEDGLFASTRDSDDTMDEHQLAKMSEQTSDTDSGETVSNMKDQEKGEEEKEQARKDSLIRWVIGSEVAKELALDLDTGEHNWGSVRQKFPLWNDQIAYYDQYIDGKYENIEDYINSMKQVDMLLKLATTLNVIYPYKVIEGIPPISAETQREEAKSALTELGDTLKKMKEGLFGAPANQEEDVTFDEIYNKQIEDAIAAENAKIEAIKFEYEQNRAALLRRLKALYAVMNEANTNLDDLNQEYNQNNEIVKKGDATTPEAKEGLDYGKTLYTNRKLSADSPQNTEFNATQENNTKNSADARNKQATAANKAEQYEHIVKVAEEQVKKVKEDLDVLRRQYVKKLSDAEASGRTQFTEFTESLRASRQIGEWTSATNEVSPLKLSESLLTCIKTYALSKVSEAKTKIDKMKDDQSLYYVAGAEKVQEIHNKMIKEITEIPLDKLAECAALGEINDFDNNSEEDIAPVINVFKDICKDGLCTTPDSDYFVGAIGLPRDFSAPKPPLEFSSAPLHEVFHFDIIDFNNVDKYYEDKDDIYSNKKMFTSFESFLNFLNTSSSGFEYGGTTYDSTVPVIWKYILKRHAFVQKEMDLTALLGDDEEAEADSLAANNENTILRAGIFPCMATDKYVVDVMKPEKLSLPFFLKDKIKNTLYTYNLNRKPDNPDGEYGNIPECRAVELKSVDGKVVVYDKEAGLSVSIDDIGTLRPGASRSSELGTIMSYVVDEGTVMEAMIKAGLLGHKIVDRASLPHRFTFNQTILDAIADINKTEDLTDDDEAVKFYMASRLLYDSNQFGDYLEQVEYESIVADSMEKIKKQIDEISGKLNDVFSAANYAISDDFNLLNESDYETAAKIMDEQKELYLDLATQKLDNIPDNKIKSQNIRDKKDKLLHKRALLQYDSEEVVTINGSEEIDELEDKIKNQQADRTVNEKYKEKEDEELERQKKHKRMPYCAFYPTVEAAAGYSPKTNSVPQKSGDKTLEDVPAEENTEGGEFSATTGEVTGASGNITAESGSFASLVGSSAVNDNNLEVVQGAEEGSLTSAQNGAKSLDDSGAKDWGMVGGGF
ncbi:MAG: hypothetical protein IKR92_01260 [Alphaproteobacteria bacterium]|nr:hypothetical protein [Alphaproteobacteria bacterium]